MDDRQTKRLQLDVEEWKGIALDERRKRRRAERDARTMRKMCEDAQGVLEVERRRWEEEHEKLVGRHQDYDRLKVRFEDKLAEVDAVFKKLREAEASNHRQRDDIARLSSTNELLFKEIEFVKDAIRRAVHRARPGAAVRFDNLRSAALALDALTGDDLNSPPIETTPR